ncbi:pumilio homology domain family member [Anaeramoeba flamelloides]|uniref:Pumilio homology domain family member n=1 Tax=Anaeramoeba flamelloides TaxID=1746091 RepID=A0AAV7ZN98_9EUKA|nr:pumilio homology domain family member [Anaeramoeba flamelloides]
MTNPKPNKQPLGLNSSKLLLMTGQDKLFVNQNQQVKVIQEQKLDNKKNTLNETAKRSRKDTQKKNNGKNQNQNQFSLNNNNNLNNYDNKNNNSFGFNFASNTQQNKNFQQNNFYSPFTNKKRLEQPKRRMMRTSASSESLTRGIDFDLYRKPKPIQPTPLNRQSLFSFDLPYPSNFSNKNQLLMKNNSFLLGKNTKNQVQRQNQNQSQSLSLSQSQTQTQNQTQNQNQNQQQGQKIFQTNMGKEQFIPRSSSMFTMLPNEMENLSMGIKKMNFNDQNQQLNKPKEINKIKKKSMARVRSFDQIPLNKKKSMIKSQTSHNLKFSKNYDTLLSQNNGFSSFNSNYQTNTLNNQNFVRYPISQQYGFNNYNYNSNIINNQNYPKKQQKFINEYQQQEYSPIDEYIGNIYKTSQNQYGCRTLQNIIDTEDERTVQIIFSELSTHYEELMKDQFGNYLCQKLFQFCSPDSILSVLTEIQQVIIPISTNLYGTRAIQKLIDCITTEEQEEILFGGFYINLITLINNSNGNHVIQKCFMKFSQEKNEFIFQYIVKNCMIIAGHKHGCCVMQKYIDFAPKVYKDMLTDKIINNALELIQNPFANYVIQYMLNNDIRADEIIEAVKGNMLKLSIQKFSSNVIEKCLRVANDKIRKLLIDEFIENQDAMKTLLMDNYANYVVQTSLKLATPNQLKELSELIRPLTPYIRNSSCLKKIQSLISKDDNNNNNNINNNNNNNNNKKNNNNMEYYHKYDKNNNQNFNGNQRNRNNNYYNNKNKNRNFNKNYNNNYCNNNNFNNNQNKNSRNSNRSPNRNRLYRNKSTQNVNYQFQNNFSQMNNPNKYNNQNENFNVPNFNNQNQFNQNFQNESGYTSNNLLNNNSGMNNYQNNEYM